MTKFKGDDAFTHVSQFQNKLLHLNWTDPTTEDLKEKNNQEVTTSIWTLTWVLDMPVWSKPSLLLPTSAPPCLTNTTKDKHWVWSLLFPFPFNPIWEDNSIKHGLWTYFAGQKHATDYTYTEGCSMPGHVHPSEDTRFGRILFPWASNHQSGKIFKVLCMNYFRQQNCSWPYTSWAKRGLLCC